ncbi:MAG: toll/interleukin-1 receptor domain-containing protein [Thermodesulfobacteriota bacterium]
MVQDMLNSERADFIWDEETGRYVSRLPSSLPEVLILSWDGGGLAFSRLLSPDDKPLPARLRIMEMTEGTSVQALMGSKILCAVLLVSRKAVQHPTFAPVVQVCIGAASRRRLFRLFVHLIDVTPDEFRSLPLEAVKDLLDTVQMREQTEGSVIALQAALRRYLQALPELRNHLRHEGWRQSANSLLSHAPQVLMIQLTVSLGCLAYLGQEAQAGWYFAWLLFGLGEAWFLSLLVLLSLPTLVDSSFFIRSTLLVVPILMLAVWPPSILAPHWPYLLAGFCTAALLDRAGRRTANAQRKWIGVDLDQWCKSEDRVSVPGHYTFSFLTRGPLLPPKAKVFISYARSSEWGRTVALSLHQAFQQAGVTSFLDAEKIPYGSSWRHRLQEELGSASVFVQVQDLVSTIRPWVIAELAFASSTQWECGLPLIVLVRHPHLQESSLPPDTPTLVRLSLFPVQQDELPLLSVIKYREDLPQTLAEELSHYPSSGVSVIPPLLGALLNLGVAPFRVLLGVLGALSCFGAWVAVVGFLGSLYSDLGPIAFLKERQLFSWFLLLMAYWLGFVASLGVASLFEVRHRLAGINARFQACTAGVLTVLVAFLSLSSDPLSLIYAGLACALGVIVAADYVATAVPLAGWMRERPDV